MIPITQASMLTLEALLITVQLRLRAIKITRLEMLQMIGLNYDETA